jgi:acetyl esterase/lipase
MSVNEATEVYETERLDPARPGGVKVPPFPVYDAPGIPDNVSDVSAVHREVTYARAIGFRPLKMDIWLPRPATAPVPLVVWVHGGAFQLGDRRELPPTFAPDSVFRLLNEAGIACATVDYRHSLEAPFPAQLQDVKAAVRYLREFSGDLGIDPDRFGAWGESAGLLVHGDSDGLVPHAQTGLLAAAVAEAGVEHEVVTINGGDHCFFGDEDQIDAILAAAVGFFSETLARP